MASSAKAAAPKKAATPAAKKIAALPTGSNGKSASAANTGNGAGSNAAVDIQPRLNQQKNAPMPTQRYGTVSQRLPIGLSESTRQGSVTMLNQLLADTTDGVARLIAARMSVTLGQDVIVDNKAGAGGVIGTKFVAQAKPDGQTLLLGHIATNAIAPAVHSPRPYDPVADFESIGFIGSTASVLVVPAKGP